jgi:hypothetical protein
VYNPDAYNLNGQDYGLAVAGDSCRHLCGSVLDLRRALSTCQ